MTRIPMTDLAARCAAIKQEVDAAVKRVIDSGGFILEPEVGVSGTRMGITLPHEVRREVFC